MYSRITGYYRPVQNWNDGKSQEYKNRKVYQVEEGAAPAAAPKAACKAEEKASAAPDGVYLFTTATCPNCKVAAKTLDTAGVTYEKILADEHPLLATQLGIKQAPTLAIVKNGVAEKYTGVSDIKKYLESLN